MKDRIQFDPSNASDNDRIGSILMDSSGNMLTSTLVGSDQALDVNVVNSGSASGIYVEDDASVEGGNGQVNLLQREDTLSVTTSADGDWGYAKITSKGEQYVHDADAIALLTTIDVDTGNIATSTGNIDTSISNLSHTEDVAAPDGGEGIGFLVKRQDTLASDVSADGDFGWAKMDSSGRIYVNASISSDVADDAASTENPILVGAVAHDASSVLGALSADGDKGHLLVDLYRQLFINDGCNVGWQVSTKTVGVTSAQLDATPLAGRKKVLIQNPNGKSIWVKNTTAVADTTSVEIPKYSVMEFPWGEALQIHAISDTAGQNIAFMEAA